MTHPLRTQAAQNIGLLALRIALGATFLLFGIEKVTKIGVGNFVHMFSKDLPDFLPRPIGQTYLYAVPFLEITVGLLLIGGLFTRAASVLATLMLISFTIAATGVFTGGNMLHVHQNIVYLASAVVLATSGGGKFSVDQALFKK